MKIQHRAASGNSGLASITTKYKAITDSAGNWSKGDKISLAQIYQDEDTQTPYWFNDSTGQEIPIADAPTVGTDVVLWEERMPLTSVTQSITGATAVAITPTNIPAEANLAEITVHGGGENGIYVLDTGEDPNAGTSFGHKAYNDTFLELESKSSISNFKAILSNSAESANLTISFYSVGAERNE
jgi:hypothetical protein